MGYILVPHIRGENGRGMPQTMCVDALQHGREIQQLQTHSHDQPRHDQAWPRSPQAPLLAILSDRKIRPESVLKRTDHHVCRHVVRVIPFHALQVVDVGHIGSAAAQAPEAQCALLRRLVKAEDAQRGHI